MVLMSMDADEERLLMQGVYARLAEAEGEVHANKTLDARAALQELRAKHGV